MGHYTVGVGRARTLNTHAVVLWRSFCDRSMNTLPGRSDRVIVAVTRFGSSRSSVNVTALAAFRMAVTSNPHSADYHNNLAYAPEGDRLAYAHERLNG